MRIVQGEIPPGSGFRLQDVQEEFNVSVTVARESVLALQGKGLVEVRPRRGVTALPRREWNLLDLDVLRWHADDIGAVIADLEQARRLIEPWAAVAAATTADPGAQVRCREAMNALSEAAERGDVDAVTEADVAFHQALLDASGNAVIASIGQLIQPALRHRDRLTLPSSETGSRAFLPLHEAIVTAIEAADPKAARDAAERLIQASESDSARATHRP